MHDNFLTGLSLMDLYDVQRKVVKLIEEKKRQLILSVSVEKNAHGATILKHPTNGSYIVKPHAYRGRLRMWKMVEGQRGLKQGPVVEHEAMGNLDDLRIGIALGNYNGGNHA